MIETKNFKSWFGKSVTTDSTGKPLIFFHKSRSKEIFKKFRHTSVEKNPYNNHYGFYFVIPPHKHFVEYLGDGIEILAWLKLENPFTITQHSNTNIVDQDGNTYSSIDPTEDFCKHIMDKGYDGIIIECIGYYNQYICFNPNQIKSVDNSGNFSLENNDIFN